jgi:antitoxin component YwqK of YwqJK toxin-antitoxin module
MSLIMNKTKISSYFILLLATVSLFLSGCSAQKYNKPAGPSELASIHIVDRNGLSETITTRERLRLYEKTDFRKAQSYKKVTRSFGRDIEGTVRSYLTSYHPNGQPLQYLEVVNARASGKYEEWHHNGTLKLRANIVGGMADLNSTAEKTWLFDGINQAWDEDDKIMANIQYQKGALQGISTYYHSNGNIWKLTPYEKDDIHGTEKTFLADGQLLMTTEYQKNKKHGLSQRFWPEQTLAAKEQHREDRLIDALYYDTEGSLIAEIKNGEGQRVIFGKAHPHEYQEYHNGVLEGAIRVFNDEDKHLHKIYHVSDNEKHGQEIEYYYKTFQAKISINWHKGNLHGLVKTWFSNGNLESQREMRLNKKNGLNTVWYLNGSIMLIEEYNDDNLVRGEYYPSGESTPVSAVKNGEGLVTLFDKHGNLLTKVKYEEGKPAR